MRIVGSRDQVLRRKTVDKRKTRCVKCVPNCASARVASSNIVY